MIIVLGTVTARQEHLQEALALGRAHVARSRAEPGCVAHALHQDADDPRRLVFVEEWVDAAALKQHFAVPASRQFVKALDALADGPPSMTVYNAQPVRL